MIGHSTASIALAFAGMLAGSPVAAALQPELEHARARLIAEATAAVPGETLAIAVTFDIDPQWHLYWDGCNDSGFPIDIRLSLPEGWVAGGVQWPAPHRRYTAAGGQVLDHIYEKRVTLIVPVQVPASGEMHSGGSAEIRAEVEWLVCREACIPGDASLTLAIPVAMQGQEPQKSREAPLFAEARADHPKPLPQTDKSTGKPPIQLSWEGSTFVIKANPGDRLRFFPRRDCNLITDRFKDLAGDKDELRIRTNSTAANARLDGILEVRNQEDRRTGLYVLTWPARPLEAKNQPSPEGMPVPASQTSGDGSDR